MDRLQLFALTGGGHENMHVTGETFERDVIERSHALFADLGR